MKNILTAISVFFGHIYRNFSNYCLTFGILAILYFIFVTYGFSNTVLSIGVILVLTSIISELNRNSRGKRY